MTQWTQEEDLLLSRLRDEGFSAREIAVRLSRSFQNVRARTYTLKLPLLDSSKRRACENRLQVARTQDLKVDAKARVANLKNTKDLGYVIGVLFGDGFVHDRAKSIGLLTTNRSFADAFAAALEEVFGEEVKREERLQAERRIGDHVYHNVQYYGAWLHRRHIVQEVVNWVGSTKTHDWKINVEDALCRGDDFCWGLVQGLVDSDGHIGRVGERGLTIRFGTASSEGAKSLHVLLMKLGAQSSFHGPNTKNEYRVSVLADSWVWYAKNISSRIDYKLDVLNEFAAGRPQGVAGVFAQI